MNGVLLIDKDAGVTSHDIVDELRRALKTRAIGHGGTLDPLATGLLVCLVGEATKLSAFVMSEEKSYRVGVRLGVRTESGDVTGQIAEEKDAKTISRDEVVKASQGLVGPLELQVPKYSAVKVKGRKLYEYAREDQDVEVPSKIMTVHSAELVSFEPEHAVFDLHCEKGTYVRSWVEKLGSVLGCGATVESLRRLKSGPFSVDESRPVSYFREVPPEVSQRQLVPMADVLRGWPALKVVGRDLALLRNGQIPKGIYSQLLHVPWNHGVRLLDEGGDLAALAVKDQEKGVKLARVFNFRNLSKAE